MNSPSSPSPRPSIFLRSCLVAALGVAVAAADVAGGMACAAHRRGDDGFARRLGFPAAAVR